MYSIAGIQKSPEITDALAKECVELIIEHWDGMLETLSQAKGMVIHVHADPLKTKLFFPDIDKSKKLLAIPQFKL